jgi:hypothetical protein
MSIRSLLVSDRNTELHQDTTQLDLSLLGQAQDMPRKFSIEKGEGDKAIYQHSSQT